MGMSTKQANERARSQDGGGGGGRVEYGGEHMEGKGGRWGEDRVWEGENIRSTEGEREIIWQRRIRQI